MSEQTKKSLTPEQARDLLWRKGVLTWKLDINQQVLHQTYKDSKEKVVVWNCSRGQGKSYTLCVIAIEECLKNPKALVKFCCPKQKDARQIIQPLFREILEDCPMELRPTFNVSEGAYKFPNGAQIQLSGLDNGRSESIRGGSAVLCIIDEAGSKSLKDLEYIVTSILLPAVTRTKEIDGKIILASTPPVSAAHPFVIFMRKAELNNSLVTRNVYTNPRMTGDMLKKIIDGYGGVDSIGFKREYLCQILTDEEHSIIPEFTEEKQAILVKEWPRPPFYDCYTAMDLGLKDLTVVLFAYFDFRNDKVVIEDEYVINGQKFTTSNLADNIRKKEAECFSDPFTAEQKEPLLRISDNNLIVINDLYYLHGLIFHPTRKDDADAALNNVRMMIASEKIIINPRCVTLIRHLRDGIWDKNRKSYSRSVDNGHFDAIDSLKYLIRNIQLNKNPYPANYSVQYNENLYKYRKHNNTSNVFAIKQMVNKHKK